ncbi:hypothetical protein CLAFUW4_10159 [Fulvia fulva]|uniref:Peroxin-14 n=1 Tax=Passalora fulva TaxID=5499 RepID=A0A9Q8LFY2_PASFU|nr:uncharacterized protein CLAFUR5_04772 [Fulvia fulva]KAK4615996.1 hypothetical protein CLAFUR4_10163 [Fulvia fulva]KAK4617126.1 hypothetical protein CLAFUR0_10161 [Fulvia fulva]UJO16896.1 hypothetical protein CLAFUR5_04772 [Fulvia fulva]WPV19566.1 hypothetical protein CLAFUW4_10159 [Fulvia fulva]WPV33761.1 hypothetical protein CLAFUW7_10159 [Fulvia fulva]
MSNGRPKPLIPEWQRTAQTKPAPTEDPVYSQPEESQGQQDTESELKEVSVAPTPTEDDVDGEAKTAEPAEDALKDAQPAEAAQVNSGNSFGVNDFEMFRQHEQQQIRPTTTAQASLPQQRPAAPPIITYPEFLVEAHKPPPLITPSRVLNFTYGAGAVAALLYGASKWILNPMQDGLSEASHDFFTHSQSKVDELNERLSKIVTKIPDTKKDGTASEIDADETDSETSDPTELYHRDMGTQTSPPPTRRSSLPGGTAQEKKDPVTYQVGALDIMKSHLDELAAGSEKTAEANKDRQETMNKLRHYLDGLTYGGGSYVWQSSEDAMALRNGNDGKNDEIEHFKKEIRAVKGLLLSAKRFPAASRPVAGAA